MEETEIEDLINTHKKINKTILKDPEAVSLAAQVAKHSHDAFVAQGFSQQEAIQLVCASMRK